MVKQFQTIPTKIIILLFVAAILPGCSSDQTSITKTSTPQILSESNPTPTPTSTEHVQPEWQTTSPEDQSMNSKILGDMLGAIKEQHLDIHSVLVVRNGYIVSETYFDPYSETVPHHTFSITKSVVSILVGIALDQGKIDRVDRPVLSFFPDRTFQNLDERKKSMTLENLLTMSSGLEWDDNLDFSNMMATQDWVQYVLDKPMVEQPGSQFNYCSGCAHVVSAILEKQTGMSAEEYARKELFDILNISNYVWKSDPNGISRGGNGLSLTTRDMAKLGYLFLYQGEWGGKEIVPADWVKKSTQFHMESGREEGTDYGFMWWTYPLLNAYAALGSDGQTIFVIPDQSLIVVVTAGRTAKHGPQEILDLIESYVVPSIMNP
ncbi:MAG: serine hydrolase [Chloroflexi bacterium]|nr:serine hydrolase [Chloroflexota bacterium]